MTRTENLTLQMYRQMLRIRLVEEKIVELYGKIGETQEMRCPVHLSIGQEAIAVGVCAVLNKTDVVFSNHRCHAHYLAKGGDLKSMIAEIYGKAAGCTGGRGGSMHLMDSDAGLISSVPIVASSIPLAVGAALNFKIDEVENIAVSFFGDGSLEEGAWHESANFAALHKLPVLFICENNLYSMFTPLNQRQANPELTDLADAYGIKTMSIDGNDFDAVYESSNEAANHIRSGNGPVFISCHTYRQREHCGIAYDDHLNYRPKEEVETWFAQDPIAKFRSILIKGGEMNDAEEIELKNNLGKEINEAFDFARSAPLPEIETASDFVYA